MRYETLPVLLAAIEETARLLGDTSVRLRALRMRHGLGVLPLFDGLTRQ